FEFATFVGVFERLDIFGHPAPARPTFGCGLAAIENVAALWAVVGLHWSPPLFVYGCSCCCTLATRRAGVASGKPLLGDLKRGFLARLSVKENCVLVGRGLKRARAAPLGSGAVAPHKRVSDRDPWGGDKPESATGLAPCVA